MSNIDIKKVPPEDEDTMLVLDAFFQKTERTVTKLNRSRDTFAVYVDGELSAVFQFWAEPVLAMFYDREGSVFQTSRIFDLIRASMQVNNVQPLVCVERDSPLREFAGRRMKEVANVDVFRMM